jgi:hypothetical protein
VNSGQWSLVEIRDQLFAAPIAAADVPLANPTRKDSRDRTKVRVECDVADVRNEATKTPLGLFKKQVDWSFQWASR